MLPCNSNHRFFQLTLFFVAFFLSQPLSCALWTFPGNSSTSGIKQKVSAVFYDTLARRNADFETQDDSVKTHYAQSNRCFASL